MAAAPVDTSGICSIRFCKWEDVLQFPSPDPVTGVLSSTITLKPGAVLYFCETLDQTRSLEETQKKDSAGPYFESKVVGDLRGSNAANIFSAKKMIAHQWVLIVQDRSGVTRLIGDKDTGADFIYNYNSGNLNTPRRTPIAWEWEYPTVLPVYTAASFTIVIGGVTISAGSLTLIDMFEVGAPGAPMTGGDTLYVHSGIANKKILVVADGLILPIDDFSGDVDWTGSIQRRVEKALASNTANFIGAVANEEIIQIYAYN